MKPLSIFFMLSISGSLMAAPLKIELPKEEFLLKKGEGRDALMANCLMCHSTEYYTTQPPLSRDAWQGIVEKMKVKFGATIPEDQVKIIVEYLASNYGEKPIENKTEP